MHPDGTAIPPISAQRSKMSQTSGLVSNRNTFSIRTDVLSGSRKKDIPAPQGPYYCGVGYKYMGRLARTIVEEHLELCLAAGINHEGINAEVAKGQWEFQIFAKGSKKAADDLWTARYLMARLCESYEVDFMIHCKPIAVTGTVLACTLISRRNICAKWEARSTSRP